MAEPSDRAPATEDVEELVAQAEGVAPYIVGAPTRLLVQALTAALRAEREQRRRAEDLLAWFAERAPHDYMCDHDTCICGLDEKQAAVASQLAARARDAGKDGRV